MQIHEAQQSKRLVRRDRSISDGASQLFAEIVDLHCLEGGCFASDGCFAKWLGCTERTIRRRKNQLQAAGLIQYIRQNGRRYCVPTVEIDDKASVVSDKPNDTDRTKLSGQPDKTVQELDNSVQELDKTVRTELSNTESYYIPPTEVNTRETRARGKPDSGNGQSDPQTDVAVTQLSADCIYKRITGHSNPGVQAVDWMQQTVDKGRSRDGPLPGDTELRRGFWETIVRTWTDSDTRNERQPHKLLNDFTNQLREHYASRDKADPDKVPSDPTENRLRILRAAAEGAGLAG